MSMAVDMTMNVHHLAAAARCSGGLDADAVNGQVVDGGEEAEDSSELGSLEGLDGAVNSSDINRTVNSLEERSEDKLPEVIDSLGGVNKLSGASMVRNDSRGGVEAVGSGVVDDGHGPADKGARENGEDGDGTLVGALLCGPPEVVKGL